MTNRAYMSNHDTRQTVVLPSSAPPTHGRPQSVERVSVSQTAKRGERQPRRPGQVESSASLEVLVYPVMLTVNLQEVVDVGAQSRTNSSTVSLCGDGMTKL